jgi:predicted acetyltransferase
MRLKWTTELDDARLERLGDVLAQCFEFPRPSFDEVVVPRIERRNLRAVLADDKLVAGCGHYDCGQYWGGRVLRFAAVATVGVLPAWRRKGVARYMMTEQLRSLASEGFPLAGLYPSTQRLYRAVGYEQAGVRMPWELPLEGLGGLDCPATPVQLGPGAIERLRPMAAQRGQVHHGQLERSAGLWSRLLAPAFPRDLRTQCYVFEVEGRDEGYVIYSQRRAAGEIRYDLHLHDHVTLSHAARSSLLSFLHDHRSLARRAIWHGAAHDELLAFTPEQNATPSFAHLWMLRVLDAKAAFEARGYPPGRSGRVEFEVHDELLPSNTGRFVLDVESGRGTWQPGGSGHVRCSARGLAACFSGGLPARELVHNGLLEADESSLQQLDAILGGRTPWMAEMF